MISWWFTQKLGKVIITVNSLILPYFVSLCGLFCRAKGDHSSKKNSTVYDFKVRVAVFIFSVVQYLLKLF